MPPIVSVERFVPHPDAESRPPPHPSNTVTRVILAGASGLIGRALADALRTRGAEVQVLVRRPAETADEIAWQPETGQIHAERLDGAAAVIHLGGESIAAGRWTPQRKRQLVDSRLRSTVLLADTIGRLSRPPPTFLCASAIGYYGDRGDERLEESSPAGTGFLPDLCKAWEAAALRAAPATRVVCARIGIVLSHRGGALRSMLTPFRFGVAGRLGAGTQYMSWIGLPDVVRAMLHTLDHPEIRGAVNLTGPEPVSNSEFTRTLARLLRRPAILPVPGFALRLLLGEMADALLLSGARVVPAVLLESGFQFRSPTLAAALQEALGAA
ncbi:MAG: TIGR01777 family protein [Phycisphaerales bacterium]|nr:TIGR01777 family protein [Phycisphaerales bacterium]